LQNNIRFGLVKNKAGRFVEASLRSVTAAANAALKDMPEDLRFSISDAGGKDSYPISGATWAVLYVHQSSDKGKLLKDFLSWATHDGQKYCAALHYARLPEGLVKRIDKKLDQIRFEK
jgi:phosphate transport system substrate-binding protein